MLSVGNIFIFSCYGPKMIMFTWQNNLMLFSCFFHEHFFSSYFWTISDMSVKKWINILGALKYSWLIFHCIFHVHTTHKIPNQKKKKKITEKLRKVSHATNAIWNILMLHMLPLLYMPYQRYFNMVYCFCCCYCCWFCMSISCKRH